MSTRPPDIESPDAGADGVPPRDELDGLLREWHGENTTRVIGARAAVLAAVASDRVASSSEKPVVVVRTPWYRRQTGLLAACVLLAIGGPLIVWSLKARQSQSSVGFAGSDGSFSKEAGELKPLQSADEADTLAMAESRSGAKSDVTSPGSAAVPPAIAAASGRSMAPTPVSNSAIEPTTRAGGEAAKAKKLERALSEVLDEPLYGMVRAEAKDARDRDDKRREQGFSTVDVRIRYETLSQTLREQLARLECVTIASNPDERTIDVRASVSGLVPIAQNPEVQRVELLSLAQSTQPATTPTGTQTGTPAAAPPAKAKP